MLDALLASEPTVRLLCFAGVFAAVAVSESRRPRRPLSLPRRVRWPGNLGLIVIAGVLSRALAPATAVALALTAEQRGWGLLNQISLPDGLAVALAVLLLDAATYLAHRLYHAVPLLWRLHRVHHADLEVDVTTGVRFHPAEILLSVVIRSGLVIALGPPAAAVVIFEVLLNAASLFNHGNLRLPPDLDRRLRWFVVTPDMHRVHHSVVRRETNSNFGFNLPWWDRLFGSYRDQPAAGHAMMTLGVEHFRRPDDLRLDRLLLQPLVTPSGATDGSSGNRAR